MIPDAPWAKEIRESWWFLLRMQSALNHGLGGGLFDRPRAVSADFESACYGLLLVQAYGALENALHHLRDDELFASKSRALGRLMAASKAQLPWINYAFVNEGRLYRNRLVHDMQTVKKAEVLGYVWAIQDELNRWASLSIEEMPSTRGG